MFGHLKAEDFVNVIENVELSQKRIAHLNACSRCKTTLDALQSVQLHFEVDDDLPEPDWNRFRSEVRDAMLSRSVVRDSAARRWAMWPPRPAMAWSMSVVFVAGLTAGMFIWHEPQIQTVPTVPQTQVEESAPLATATG